MKSYILSFLVIISAVLSANSQEAMSNQQINRLVMTLKAANKKEDEIKTILNGIIKDPDLYNTLWQDFLKQSYTNKNKKFQFLDDLNIAFKTFQSKDSTTTSLGFSYDFNFDYAKFIEKDKSRISHTLGLSAKGNVAFNKRANPNNLLETKVFYNYAAFIGGVIKQHDTSVFSELNDIETKLVKIKDMKSKEAIALWDEFGDKLKLSNQYYYGIGPKFAFEATQDFSKTQFTPGITIDLGAKAWNKKNILSKLNILDYPFALIRLITGTDKSFTVYGATIPTVQLTLDYVIPSNDSTRRKLIGNLNPFPRFKFETSFRTFISRIRKENIFFNADYRFYQELAAPAAIKNSNFSSANYFVMALQSTSGMFVSYASGKLPFDARNDQVYSIGFSYKF
ncbi:hypothetical protein [Niabella soli]|uniref:DUF3078 domain-containing protein n=1 Tax=Niabella soli DSM 19437 TaxID=929713 RepID=W0F5C4_9BACT|nr:hypothetical protein [Niabella soli]AHF17023.1 hypothetical protein NIASO_00445 [Niabella soli DSM 19437]